MSSNVKNDLNDKYSKGIIIIHWISSLLIISIFVLGLSMDGLKVSDKVELLKPHAVLGLLLFILTIIRSIMFFKSKRPADLKTGSKFNDKLVIMIYNSFYILLILIGLSGIITMIIGGYLDALQTADLSLIKDDDDLLSLKVHGFLAFLTMGLVFIHIVGVIKHFIKTKENTLKRIL